MLGHREDFAEVFWGSKHQMVIHGDRSTWSGCSTPYTPSEGASHIPVCSQAWQPACSTSGRRASLGRSPARLLWHLLCFSSSGDRQFCSLMSLVGTVWKVRASWGLGNFSLPSPTPTGRGAVGHTRAFSSVQFSRSVMSDSLQPHELQHARPPCPLPTPGVHSNSCPSSRWCHPAISSSVFPFSSCPQSLPASGSFPMSQLFPWGDQKYWNFGFSISPSNEHPGLISSRMDWLDLLAVPGTLKSLLQHHSSKASILQRSAFFTVQLSHPYMTTGKTIALTRWTFVGKVMSLLFNMLSRLRLRDLQTWIQS